MVLGRVGSTAQDNTVVNAQPLDIVASDQRLRPQVLRGFQQIPELHGLVAADTGNRRLAPRIAVGEIIHNRLGEPALIVEHIVRNTEMVRHRARIIDVLAGTAHPLPGGRLAMVIKLQRHTDGVVAGLRHKAGSDRAVDATGHGHDDTTLRARFCKVEIKHGRNIRRTRPRLKGPHALGRIRAQSSPSNRAVDR